MDYDRVAIILTECAFYGDAKTAHRWQITTRSIRRYRKLLADDSELAEVFFRKKADFSASWADEIPGAIRASLRFLTEAATEANCQDPAAIAAMADALRVVAEIELTRELLDAKLNGFALPKRTKN